MSFLGKIVASVANLVLAHWRISPRDLRRALSVAQIDPSTTVLGVLRLRAVQSSADFAAENMQDALVFDSPNDLRGYTAGLIKSRTRNTASTGAEGRGPRAGVGACGPRVWSLGGDINSSVG